MRRIIVPVTIRNTLDPIHEICFEASVDTSARWLTLPTAWRSHLGELPTIRTQQSLAPNQRLVLLDVCGPVTIQIEGFRPIVTEVIF